ncbi:metal-dependent hydrolase [Yersinia mollaretii]|uniref:Metal-dependent hydrolase n=1 Tax=Yersinia mollaretii TaxID=33060 RepID=A0AA44CKE6_YERMO|nr:TatD family hydrolase [Yersinia mollaretii]NIL22345.1 metal-dependent hydrolase [Yersinia mollaretii]CNI53426.1 putative metalloenzyme [Yersinia mollaretii]CNK69939.1 putative metalloenzyme [Yersinia enterocolitica]CQQ49541.1 putative metalloenzyme [Yersinia mollaretii]
MVQLVGPTSLLIDPPYFVDTHCHFDFPPFSGAEAASLASAAQANVRQLIIPAVSAAYFPRILALAERYPPLFAALGLHPLYIAEHQEADLATLASYLANKPEKLLAVGEMGLDLYMDEPQFPRQLALLQAQLKLAKQHDLPVILHSRRSHDQLAAALRKAALPCTGVVHGFAGSLAQAQAFIRLGYYIGVGGTITYERAQKTRNVMAVLPLSALLLETDAPDMPLAGFQGQPNRPERAAQVFAALCELRPEAPHEIATHLLENSQRLFQLPPVDQSSR